MLAPGAVIAGPYWGQIDAVGTLVVLGAIVFAARRQWIVAAALGALATLMKFQFGIALFVVCVAASVEAFRTRSWRPLLVFPAALIADLVIATPFGLDPVRQWELLKNAGEEYPFTSLYAFNIWAIDPGFWKPDTGLVLFGGVLLAAAAIASVIPLWWRRDLATLLAAGAVASLAFYFLPTRAHERYLFPGIALLVPFAASRWRLLPSWIVLSVLYATTLIFALVRTVFTDVTVPASIDTGLFSRTGQVTMAIVMCLAALVAAALVVTVDRSFAPHPAAFGAWVRRLASRSVEIAAVWRAGVAGRIAAERAHPLRVQRAVIALALGVPMLFNAVVLLPELTVAVPSNNDDADHIAYIEQADAAIANGEDPLDFWAPQMEFGFPPFVYYQHLPHLAVVALHRTVFFWLDLMTIFDLVRWVLLVTLPLTVWWSLRTLGVPAFGAAVAGGAAALVAGGGRFGIEYDSFVWRGWGMYTQLWGVHLTFLSLAAVHAALERGRGVLRAVLLLSALALSHLIWAYMTAISVLVIFAMGLRRATWRERATRLALLALPVALITSYMWLPFLQQRAFLNVSQPYLPPWRFDSFGFGQIATWLVTGDLLDHARLPVFTLLLFAGVVAAIRWRERTAMLALALFGVWLVLWSGRTSLGAVADLLPFSHGLHVHRFVGGVDVAAVMLIGVGAAAAWRLLRADDAPRRALIGGVALLVLFVPVLAERADYYGWSTTWMTETRDAIARDADVAGVVAALQDLPPGRVYAGLNDDWQKQLDFVPFNSARFPDVLNLAGLPRMAKPYASLSLTGDLAFTFDVNDRAQWDLFNVRYAVARAGQSVPAFLTPIRAVGKYTIYGAPTSGWTTFAQSTTTRAFANDYDLFYGERDSVPRSAAHAFAKLDYPAPAAAESAPQPLCYDTRRLAYERMQDDRYDALLGCDTGASLVVLKITYHPNWHVTVDDQEVKTYLVSPGFIGFDVPQGMHFITARYVSSPAKTPLVLVGLLTIAGLVVARRRRIVLPRMPALAIDRRAALGIAALALTLIPRIPTLAQPLLEKHPFRQTWTAWTALVYHQTGIDLLNPVMPAFGPPYLQPQEFPIFQAVASVVMDVGIPTDPAMRVTSLLCFFATALLLFGLVRHIAGGRAALFATGFFVLTPFGLVWSRASLIEYLATAGMLGYAWAGIRYREDRTWSLFAIALAAGALGLLVKPTTGIFGLVPLALYRSPHEVTGPRAWLRERLDPRFVALAAVPGLLAVIWTASANAELMTRPATEFLALTNARDYYLDLAARQDPAIWGLIASRFVYLVVGVPFLLALAVGLVVGVRGRTRGFWIGAALALVLPILIVFGGYRRHDYYQVAISPWVAAFVGLGLAWLLAWVTRYGRAGVAAFGAATIVALAFVYVTQADYWRPIYDGIADPESVLPAARELAALSRPDDVVVMVGRGYDPDILFYARRKGLLIAAENAGPKLYRTLPTGPYTMFFSVDPAHDATDVMRWWNWNGAVGPRTYEVGADPASLARSDVLSTDDGTAFDRAAASGRAIATSSVTIPCDGRSVPVPVDPGGTWLLVNAPSGTIVSFALFDGPMPVRRVFVLRPEVMAGQTTVNALCAGPGSLVVERAVAAPVPAR